MIWTRSLLLKLAATQPLRLVALVLHLQEHNRSLQLELEEAQQQLREKNQELNQQ